MPKQGTTKKIKIMKQEQTINELAAVLLRVYANITDNHILFQIAEGTTRYNNLTQTSKNTTVSKWFKSERIQNMIKNEEFNQRKRDEEIIKKERERIEREAREQEGKKDQNQEINFLDPDEFMKFASLKANELQDEKDRRAYLEMIAKLMNYKDKDQEEQEQIRAYLPETCEKCELYKRCSVCSFSSCPVVLQ